MKKLYIYLYGLIIILYTTSLFLQSNIIDYILLFMVLCLLALSVSCLKSLVKYIAMLVICVSMYIIFTSDTDIVFFS
ncbi:MAG: hypothetical protein HPY66_0133 [Firmicutes bacterium]|nr:hypothetical protein [Bacillota bacterium]